MLAAEDMDAATADSTAIRFPMRMKFFDNLLIRDVLLSRRSNVIIDSKGDVYQWGKTYGSETPVKVLKGWKVQKAAISNGVIYLLRGNGEIVFMPELLADQKAFHSDQYRRNWHFGSSELPFSRLSGQFQDIAAGKSHLVALSVDGRVFTASTGLADEDLAQRKNKGQFGVPFITQFDPLPAPNQLHEVALLSHIRQKNRVQRRHITKIAAGNNHTLALDEFGEVWSWGLNTYGQLGQLVNYNSEIIPVPKKITLKGHFKTGIYPVATDVYAGGNFSFAKYQAKDINRFFQQSRNGAEAAPEEEMTDFYFAFGNGINGSLGIGKYVHSQAEPAKIKLLNDMKEYNEAVQEVVSVPVRNWSVGLNHVITTLHNSLNNATDNDVLVWGGNAFGQLGNGKKTQACKPVYVPTLLEPDTGESTDTARMLRLNNINNSRLQIGVRGKAEQVVVAGDNKSALFYRA
ncbi:hypothetical protein BABINDRAFT_163264 [Babjeviella inositovora NRRL Y-12698]|uniref:Uncharacterized protein n=1 Tax=Babjeviella inositovora NRRL Y-12698 TaxID=984486 RepID=A0A1E3QJR0_9ASCO|nr:uncharacterized protein BABINDRAFT_163264 [Babjeviella inositovora NRRL Y-12698]ODQ77890.1 hypothetical protein BABINDRAFT_163264 [Babjeviella inositovora NRRL Y-12698]